MLIGQLSKLTGFSRDTIRYYEKIELICLPKKSRLNRSYKDYPEELVFVLNAIRKYKEMGFTLEEIRELLVLQSVKVLDTSRLLDMVDTKIKGIDAEIDRLHKLKLRLGREHLALTKKSPGRIVTLPELRIAA